MHQSVRSWAIDVIGHYDLYGQEVLEVGSLDENGSIRDLFNAEVYCGVDMRPGPGVDVVCNGNNLHYWQDHSWDIVVSTEMLEHDARFWLSLEEMGRVLKPKGYLMLTMRGNGFPHHAYPNDYWRFMPSAADSLLELADCDKLAVENDPQDSGLFIVGQKRDE